MRSSVSAKCFCSSLRRSDLNLFNSASYSSLISPGTLNRGIGISGIVSLLFYFNIRNCENNTIFCFYNKITILLFFLLDILPLGMLISSPFIFLSISCENLVLMYSQSCKLTKFFCFVADLSQEPMRKRHRGQHKELFSMLPLKQL